VSRLSGIPVKTYTVAVILALLALVLSLLLSPFLSRTTLILFIAAVTISAAYGGLWPSLLTVVLSVIFAIYFMPPEGLLAINTEGFIALVIFAIVSATVSVLYERQKRAERGVSEQREALRVTLTSIGDAVITTDTTAAITFLNPVAETLTGWSAAEAKKRDIQTVFNIVNEYTRQPAENPVIKVMASGKVVGLANHTLLIARDGTEYAIDDSAAPIRNAKNQLAGVVLVFRDISERRASETAQQTLIKVSDWLASARNYQNYQEGLSDLAALLGPQLADWYEMAMVENDQLVRKAVAHHDPSQSGLLGQFYAQLPTYWPTIDKPPNRAAALGKQTALNFDSMVESEPDSEMLQRLKTLNPVSRLDVQLYFDDEPLGVLSFYRSGNSKRQPFTPADLEFAEELSRRIASGIDNARLYWKLNQSRRVAEQTADRLARQQAITGALHYATLPIDVAKTIVEQTIAAIDGAYGSLVAVINEREQTLQIIYSAGFGPERMRQYENIPLAADRPLAQMVRDGQPVFIESNADWIRRFPQAGPFLTTESMTVLPLRIDEKIIGCLIVSFNEQQLFPETDRAFLLNLADKCSQALHRVQLYAAEKQAREQIDAIMEGVSDAFYSFDHELRYTYVNSRAAEVVGIPRDQLIGKRLQEIVPPNQSEVFLDHASHSLAERVIVEYEQFSPLRNTWSNVRLYPYAGGLTVFIQDITARKQAEADAHRYALQLKGFVQAGVVGIIFAKADGQITDANDCFLEMIGYSRAELEQGQLNWLALTPPEYSKHDQLAIEQVQKTGKPAPAEKEYIHKDGHRVPVLIGGIPVEDTWISFVLDLTERKRAESRLQALTEASAMLSVSLDYRTTLARVAQTIVPALADWCTIHLKEPDGSVQQVALAHRNPEKIAWGHQIQRDYPDDPSATTGLYQVIRGGQAEFYPEITDEMLVAAAKNDDKLLHLLREIGYSALIIVPLKIQNRVVGAIQLVSTESRQRYTTEDLTLAEDIARRAAVAIDNAQLYSEVYQEREHLQVTLASIGDAVIATDIHGGITFLNRIAENLTGWTHAEAIGQPLNTIFHILNAETQQVVESPIEKVLREGGIANLAEHTVLITKDGMHIPIDDSGAPIRDRNNALIGVILVFRDIRIRREAEKQLETTLQRTSDLYNTSRQIGVAASAADILNALLSSRYLQQTSQAAIIVFNSPWKADDKPSGFEIAASLIDSMPPGFASNRVAADSLLLTLFSAGRTVFVQDAIRDQDYDVRLRTLFVKQSITSFIMLPLWAGGACFGLLALYSGMPYLWSPEDFEHIRIFADQVAIVMDNVRLFDAERIARQEAERANALRLKFLAMISHELRTPLTSIKGFTTSLLAADITWAEHDRHEFISIIDEEADKLTELISQLLDLSQLQAGTLRIRPVVQTIRQITDIATMELTMLTHRHHLTIDLPTDVPPVMADPQRIAQVLTNLVGNAVKYAPEGTAITISAALADNSLQINVSDEGPGIPPEKRQTVFEAFQQLERKALDNQKGAGLGLAICKGLVEAHHGHIWVDDKSETGSTFSFTLPLAQPEEAHSPGLSTPD
jgi:PAS domain S-box-containing protein